MLVLPQSAEAVNLDPGKSKEALRKAGASAAALEKFDAVWRQSWPEQAAVLEDYVLRLSPEGLAAYISRLSARSADDQYVRGPDYEVRPEVPRGTVLQFDLEDSRVFPGTARKIRVYVPAAYTGERAACVYVALDDLFFGSPAMLDNLIHRGEMPVLIAIGLRPGTTSSAQLSENPRLNRTTEFDTMNGDLARFLLEEVFPQVEKRTTSDGIPLRLSSDPNDRAIGGVSSGAVGSFTVAWQRPDAFQRVFLAIGSFVGMRGGDRYPVLVRKTEPKPLRVFMQDGSADQLTDFAGEMGNWWLANQTMLSALEFAGYDATHEWGEGGHTPNHAFAVFPDAMRWLWRDWPKRITPGVSRNTVLRRILRDGEGWQEVAGPQQSAAALASDLDGSLLMQDSAAAKTWSVSTNGLFSDLSLPHHSYTDISVGPDGTIYVADFGRRQILASRRDGTQAIIAQDIRATALAVAHGGAVYVSEAATGEQPHGRLWLIDPSGTKTLLDDELKKPSGIARSPDGLWLAVAEGDTHWGYSYRIERDGRLRHKQRFYWFHVPDDADNGGARTWQMDFEGRLYSATRMGVQIFDRNGRARAILPVPGGRVMSLAFGAAQFDMLYVSSANGKLYRRHLNVRGVPAWSQPVALPAGEAN